MVAHALTGNISPLSSKDRLITDNFTSHPAHPISCMLQNLCAIRISIQPVLSMIIVLAYIVHQDRPRQEISANSFDQDGDYKVVLNIES